MIQELRGSKVHDTFQNPWALRKLTIKDASGKYELVYESYEDKNSGMKSQKNGWVLPKQVLRR